MPEALTAEGVIKVKKDFISAAKRAIQAGYQVVELHAAHGYLLHQFLSPASNHRTDEYGGSFENRIRLLHDIVGGIRQNIPESCLLFVRISATDWVDGGWSLGESVALAKILKRLGVDLIDCSSGGNVAGVKITLEPGYQVRFAETIKKESGILTGAVGLITTSAQAEEILANNRADMILLGREFLRDPYFAMHAASELGTELVWPNQYLRAKKK
jgi:2,4-dienoyl-CoA reductase-like NADH-dependent reductase (Old Yellow Enzyme family)